MSNEINLEGKALFFLEILAFIISLALIGLAVKSMQIEDCIQENSQRYNISHKLARAYCVK